MTRQRASAKREEEVWKCTLRNPARRYVVRMGTAGLIVAGGSNFIFSDFNTVEGLAGCMKRRRVVATAAASRISSSSSFRRSKRMMLRARRSGEEDFEVL